MSRPVFDVAVVGGGLVGLATARAVRRRGPSVVVLEAEDRLAGHQSGRNSGVIHSGLYYEPGSLKARLCAAGRDGLYALCEERGIAHRRCGKLVVATREEEIPRLDELERRGRANGLTGLERLDGTGLRRHEPEARGIDALWVPQTGIVDFPRVAAVYAEDLLAAGAEVRLGAAVRGVEAVGDGLAVRTASGEVACGKLVNCAGLQCDRVARMCGLDPDVRIVPFRGEYYYLQPDRSHLVRGLVYPVPDPAFPFLGVHFTRRVDGSVEAGPNAVLALDRHGYDRRSAFSLRDAAATIAHPGFWRLAARHWLVGAYEVRRSLSRRLFARDLQRLVPAVRAADLIPGGCGIRAQAVDRRGNTLDDFAIESSEHAMHVLNAPSPGATASLAIGEHLAERLLG